jgi:hypothetical protein
MGREAVDGAFEDFVARIAAAHIRFSDRSTAYQSPSLGLVEFGWKGPLRLDGEVVSLSGYPRSDTSYGSAPFPAEEIAFHCADHHLTLDWKTASRKTSS